MSEPTLKEVHRVLVAVDGSEASRKEVDYVVDMVSNRPAVHLHLVHVLPPVELSAVTPQGATHQREEASSEARAVLSAMRDRIVADGFDGARVDAGSLSVSPEASLVDGLLEAARDQGCGTIVVGRNSLPWYREAFHHHPADELVKHAHGFAVWIVE